MRYQPHAIFGINYNASRRSNALPCWVHVMYENNEYDGAIDGTKWNNRICVLGAVWAGKCKLLSGWFSNMDLVLAWNGVHEPFPSGTYTWDTNSCITTWDRHSNHFGNGVKSDAINTKFPNKVLNVSDILLMRLGGQKLLGNPFTMINLLGMTKFNKLYNGFSN